MSKGKIIIIDDNDTFRALVHDALEEAGFDVTELASGTGAVETILSNKPDLVLLDQILPDMDGGNILLNVRKDENGRNIPVIALTQSEEIGRVAGNLKLGVTKYLVKKDNSVEKIVNLVTETLKHKVS